MSNLTLDQYHHLQDLVKALESEKYKQGKHRLRQHNCYCVMGVACDVFDSTGWHKANKSGVYIYKLNKSKEEYPFQCTVPDDIEVYYGLTSSTIDYLMELNDCRSYTFKDIAYWIKENLIKPASEIYTD